MPRTKIVITPFQPWETRNNDGKEKRYFRLGATLLASQAMLTLSPSAFKVLCYMKIESAGSRKFTYPHAKYRVFMSKPTFYKARDELIEHGFIDIVQNNKNLRKANVYMFSDRWKSL